MKNILLCASIMLSVLVVSAAYAEIRVGVMAPRGALKAMAKWKEMGSYLEKSIGEEVKIIPLDPKKTLKYASEGKIDYALTNPVLSLNIMKKHLGTPIVTLKRKSGSQFGGVIIAKKGSNILKAQDLKGKNVLAFKFKVSAAAYVFQIKHLFDQGVNPEADFKSFKEAKKQDDIVLAVKNGLVDAGFIKTGILESMEKEGKVKLADFEIIDKRDDGFAHVHSTVLYPEWTLTALPNAKSDSKEKMKASLLALGENDEAAKKAKIHGFVEPLSFDGLDSAMKTLKLGPYE